MKFFIIALLLVQSCSSKNKESTKEHFIVDSSSKLPFYNLILEELNNDVYMKYSIVIELDEKFHINDKIKQSILGVKTLSEAKKKWFIKKVK